MLQQGRKHYKPMVFSTLLETRLLQPKISIWVHILSNYLAIQLHILESLMFTKCRDM